MFPRMNKINLFVAAVGDGLCTGMRYRHSHDFAQCDWGGSNQIIAFDSYDRLANYVMCCNPSPQEFLLSHYHSDHYKGLVKASRLSQSKIQSLNWEPEIIYLPGMPIIDQREEFYLTLFTMNVFILGDLTGCIELDLFKLIRKLRTKSPTFKYRFLYQGDTFDLAGEKHIVLWPPRHIANDTLTESITKTLDDFNRLKEENDQLKKIYDRIKNSNIVDDLIKQASQEYEKINEMSDFIEKNDGVYIEENYELTQNQENNISELNKKLINIANHLSLAFYKESDLLFLGDVSPQVIPKIVQLLQTRGSLIFKFIIAPHHGTYWDNSLLKLKATKVLVSTGPKLSSGLQQQWNQVGTVISTHNAGDIRI